MAAAGCRQSPSCFSGHSVQRAQSTEAEEEGHTSCRGNAPSPCLVLDGLVEGRESASRRGNRVLQSSVRYSVLRK